MLGRGLEGLQGRRHCVRREGRREENQNKVVIPRVQAREQRVRAVCGQVLAGPGASAILTGSLVAHARRGPLCLCLWREAVVQLG